MKIPKIKLNKIKIFFKKFPRILGEHAFLTFLTLLFGGLVFGGFIFYKYSILIEKTEPGVFIEKPLQFKEETYQKVLEGWQAREKRFNKIGFEEYPNPFEIPTTATTSVSEEASPEVTE